MLDAGDDPEDAAVAVTDTIELRDGYAELTGARLHYVEAGTGPLVVLLHGFPEFWYGWRSQILPMAGAGFRVVAPDLRGYNMSSRPKPVSAYGSDLLAADIRDLIHERGAERARVAGHDWGGLVAWATAMNHPEVVEKLAILNAPHPARMLRGMRRPRQMLRSWYVFFFQLPWLPERVGLRYFQRSLQRDGRRGSFTDEDLVKYRKAWSRPGAMTAMINYYRTLRQSPGELVDQRRYPPVLAPTLMIWGERDRYLGAELAEPDRADVPNFDRVVRFPEASHWVQHDEPERVSELLIEFFREDWEGPREGQSSSVAD
jgi:epoxide hydrolase 4